MKAGKMVVWMITGVVLCHTILMVPGAAPEVRAKTVKAGISAKKVKIGSRIRIKAKTKNVSYKSSNSVIASVDKNGVVTGKKEGKVEISVIRKGDTAKKYTVTVKKRARKPASLPVTFSEISLKEIKKQTVGNAKQPQYQIRVTNHAKKGKVMRIVYHYKVSVKIPVTPAPVSPGAVTVGGTEASGATQSPAPSENKVTYRNETKKVTLTAKNIKAGKTVTAVRAGVGKEGDAISLSNHSLVKIELYTGKALYVYDAATNRYTFQWGTKDTKAPVITGLVKKNSATGNNDIYRVYYSDRKNSYNFRQFVTAKDDRDGTVKIKADTSKINWKKQGVYKLWFSATDHAGNTAKSWAKVRVYVPGSAESAADQILRSITRSSWSDERKARAIYRYITGHCSYVQHSSHIQWRQAALKGLRYNSGDCYTYYAISRLLLTRAGIPNVMIKRYPTPGGQRHFWNLTYIRGGWYHFDTTPRQRREEFCLWTDAQLWNYSSGYTFQFKRSAYPERATKRI